MYRGRSLGRFLEVWSRQTSRPDTTHDGRVEARKTRTIDLEADGINPSAWDFTRMYTNIPQDKLIDNLMLCVRWCLHQPTSPSCSLHKYVAIQVVTGRRPSAEFLSRGEFNPGASRFSKTSKSKSYVLDVLDIEQFFSIMIKFTFIQFGDQWLWQTIGIPIGIGPAPYFAKLYLARPELDFMQRLRDDVGARDIFEAFFYINRFIDDGYFVNNPFIRNLLYEDMVFRGHTGLYDRCLVLNEQILVNLRELPFLDILAIYRIVAGVWRILTKLYDKRLQPGFANLPIVRFIPAFSSVNEAAKRNIISGRFQRLAKIITNRENFRFHMARIGKDLEGRKYKLNIYCTQVSASIGGQSRGHGTSPAASQMVFG